MSGGEAARCWLTGHLLVSLAIWLYGERVTTEFGDMSIIVLSNRRPNFK